MDRDAVIDAHARASARFAALLASLPADPVDVPPLRWNTAEVGAHVLSLYRGYVRAAQGGPPLWPGVDGVDGNQRLLDETPEREHAAIAAAVAPAGDQMRKTLGAAEGRIAVFGDVAATPAAILAFNMADTLIHGFDICRALGRAWPIDGDDAALGLEGLLEVLPAFVRPGSTLVASYRVSLRRRRAWIFRFADSTLTIADGHGRQRVDCRISAEPATWLLTSYGRMSPLRAGLTGKVVAYGRKPWLAPRIAEQFDPP